MVFLLHYIHLPSQCLQLWFLYTPPSLCCVPWKARVCVSYSQFMLSDPWCPNTEPGTGRGHVISAGFTDSGITLSLAAHLWCGGRLYSSVPWVSLPGSAFQPVAPLHPLSRPVNMLRFGPHRLPLSLLFLPVYFKKFSLPSYTFLDASPNRGGGALQEVPAHSWPR